MTTTSTSSAAADGQLPGGGRRPRWWLLVAVAAAVAVVVVVVVVALGGGDGDDDATDQVGGPPSLPPPVSAAVDAEGQELLDLLETGRSLTVHARYEATGDEEAIGTELTVDLWRRDGQVRQDTHQVTEAGTVDTAGFLLEDDVVISCQRVEDAEWTCATQSAAGQFTADALFGTVASQLQGSDVVVTDEEVNGEPARCFAVTATDGPVNLCVAADGLPLRLRGEDTELVLTERSDDVPEETFTPPAEPVSAEAEG